MIQQWTKKRRKNYKKDNKFKNNKPFKNLKNKSK